MESSGSLFAEDEVHKPKFKRIPGFNPNSYHKKRWTDCNIDEKAEYARAFILCGVNARTHISVHVSNPDADFMLYKAVFEEMLDDPDLTDDARERLADFGRVSSLSATPSRIKLKKLSQEAA